MLNIQTSRPCTGLSRARRPTPAPAALPRRTRTAPATTTAAPAPAATLTASVMTAFVEPLDVMATPALASPARRHRSEQALVANYLSGLVG